MEKTKIWLDGRRVKGGGGAGSVRGLLVRMGVSPQEALVRVDGKIRPEGHLLSGAKKIEVIRVVFGG